ncbi:uncharacterized protein LOC144915723 isoform X3 [Branchiostoma floridae x Branchiostoma belcheri]
MDPVSGAEGDEEWSENDALDNTDELVNPDIASELEEMADEPESPRFIPKLDAADLIMDAIDRELYEVMRIDGQEKRPKSPSRPVSASRPKSPSRTWSPEKDSGTASLRSSSPGRRKRPGKTEREVLMAAGVEFDTGDETTASTAREEKQVVRMGGSVDTGLGTSSSRSVDQVVSSDEVENEIQKQRRIKGKVSTYSDGEEEEEDQYQDQEDTMLYETAEASRGAETRNRFSKDEDDSSHEPLHPSHDSQPSPKSSHDTEFSEHSGEESNPKPTRVKKSKAREMSDTDSVRTEDFEKKFREISGGNPWTSPSSKHNSADSDSTVTDGETRKSRESSDNEKGKKHEKPGIWDSLPPHLRPYRKNSKDTDTSSVATEDFESKFKDSVVLSDADNQAPKKKAPLQNRPTRADSGASSIKTEDFEEKFKDMVVSSNSHPVGSETKQSTPSNKSKKVDTEQKQRSPSPGAMPRKYLYLTMKDLTSTDTESNVSERMKGKGANKKGSNDSAFFDYDKWKKDLEGDIEFARNEDSLCKDVHDSGHDDLNTSDDVESIHTSESWSPEGTILQKTPTRHSSPMPQQDDRSPSPKQRPGSPSRRPTSPLTKRPRSPEKDQPSSPPKVHPSSNRITIEEAWEVDEGSLEKQVPNGFLSQDVEVSPRRGVRHYSSPDTSSSLEYSGELAEGDVVPTNVMPQERIDILSKYLDKQLDSINKGETGDSTAVEEEEEDREGDMKKQEERGVLSQPPLYREGSYTSLDTCRTEEYNDRFRRLMVKQVAGVPITSFDTVTVASDLDSVRTDTVRDRFQEVIGGKGASSRATTDFELSEAESERPEKRHAASKREALEDGLSDFESVKAFPSRTPRYGVVVDSEAEDIGNDGETEVVSDVEDSPKHTGPDFSNNSYYSDGAIRNRRQSLMRRLAAVDTRGSVSFDSYTTNSEGSSFENDDLLSMEVIQRLRAIEASGCGNDNDDDDVFESTNVNEKASPMGIPVLEVSEVENDDHKYSASNEQQADPTKLADYKTVFINNWMGAKQPYENDIDYMLRIRSAASSPGPGCLSRGSSFDSSSGTVSDLLEHRVGSAEQTLLELGFGGAGFDIPVRFLPSLRQRLKNQANAFWLAGQDAKSPTALWSSRHSSQDLSSDDGQSDAQSLRSIETESESLIFGKQSEEKSAKRDHVREDESMTETQRSGKIVKIAEDCGKRGNTSDVDAAAKRKRLVKAATITSVAAEAMNSPGKTQNVISGSAHATSLPGRTMLDLMRLKRKRMHFVKQKSLPTNLETLPEVEEKPRMFQSSSSESKHNSSPTQSTEDQSVESGNIKDNGTGKSRSPALEVIHSISINSMETEPKNIINKEDSSTVSNDTVSPVQHTFDVKEQSLTSGNASLVHAELSVQGSREPTVKGPCSEGITVDQDHNHSDRTHSLADSKHGEEGYQQFGSSGDYAQCNMSKPSEISESGPVGVFTAPTKHGSDNRKVHASSNIGDDDKDDPQVVALQGNKPSDEEMSDSEASAGPNVKLFVQKVSYKDSLLLELPLILQLPIMTAHQCFSDREAAMLLQDDQAIGQVTDFDGRESPRSCSSASGPSYNPCSNVWRPEPSVHYRGILPNAANVGYMPVSQGKPRMHPTVGYEMDTNRNVSMPRNLPQTEYDKRGVSKPSKRPFFDENKGKMASNDTTCLDRSSKPGAMGSSDAGRRRDSGKMQSTPKTYSTLPDVSASMPNVSAISAASDRIRSPARGGRYHSYEDINSTIMPRTNQSPSSLRDADQGLRDANKQKQAVLSEMREIQESLKSKRSEVSQAEHEVQDMQTKSDELRAEIMVLEYKRDSVEKELQGLHKDLEARTRPSSRQRDRDELGMSKEQVLEVIRERDELRARLRSGEGQISGLERRELERQLNAAKEDLFSEQRKSRAKVEELQDELEECKRQLEESQLDKGDAVHQMEQLHLKVKELERARKRDIENKTDALDNANKRTRVEVTDLRSQLAERDKRIVSLEAELHEKDKLNRKLQETVYKMQEELSQESELKDSLIEENEKNVVKLKKDKETSLAALRHMLLEDKQRELDRLRDQSDRERRDILARQEERMAEQLAEMEQRILAKDDEVTMVRERLRQQEEATRTLGDRMRLEAKEQIRSAISKEKASWETEKERAVQREKDRWQDESNKQLSKVQEELEKEKQLHNQADKNCTGLKQELDQARQQVRAAHRDKLAAINEVRDSMKVEKEEEIKQLREQLTQEKVSDVEKLREKIRKLEDELRTSRSERNAVAVREKETSMLLDRHEKSVVSEINDECQKSAQLLGTAPRSVRVPSGDQEDDEFDQSLDISENRGQSPHKSRSAVSEALANLKATNEDLRQLVTGLHEDMASQKKATQQVNKEKEREVKQLRELYHSEKEKEVETMRERLIQDHLDEISKLQQAVKKDKDEVSSLQHNIISKDEELREIQRNMTAWKDATIKKLAKKFEQEMNLELEKRQHEKDRQAHSSQLRRIEELEEEVQRLSVVRKTFQSTPSTPSRVSGPSSSSQSGGDASTIKLLRHLQERVKQLRVENKELRRLSGEGGDAINGNGTPDVATLQEEAILRESPYVQNLERKLKHMDRQLNIAEERAQKNTALLGQKMVELTKLQNQLTHQTKEYLHLERSYSDMQKRYHRGGHR